MRPEADARKTLLIGLDAACWEYLDPLLASGRLPNLSKLMDEGVHGRLRSVMPPITPAAWSSLISGVNPGKHRVYEWMERRRGDYQFTPVTSNHRVGTPFWNRLNKAGIRTGVLNIPLTYPVKPLEGFMVCGFSTPASQRDLTYPAGILDEIEAKFGPYHPDVEMPSEGHSSPEAYQAEREHQARQVRIAAYLANTHQVQVLVINLMLLDHANHTMPSYELVEQAMLDCDADLGFLLEAYKPSNVLLISDHGSRRVRGVFMLSAWLAEHGYLCRAARPLEQQAQVLNYLLTQWRNGNHTFGGRAGRRLLRESLMRLPGTLTSRPMAELERAVPLSRLQMETLDQLVPEKSQVYTPSTHRGNIYLNLEGREPQGILPVGEQEALLEKLTAELSAIQDPESGEPLFAGLYRPEDIYSGPFSSLAPDLTGDYYASNWSVVSKLPGLNRRKTRYFLTGERWYGDHSQDGIFIFTGEAFRQSSERLQANILDIPASLLYLHGVPVPEDYDGQPLVETMQEQWISQHPVEYQPGDIREDPTSTQAYSLTVEEELLGRLSALGYLGE